MATTSKKIDKLTNEQIDLMHDHRNQYIDFIVSNKKYQDPQFFNQLNLHVYKQRHSLKEDIDWIYRKSNLAPPKFVFEAGSYLQEKMMVNYLLMYTNIQDDSAVKEITDVFGSADGMMKNKLDYEFMGNAGFTYCKAFKEFRETREQSRRIATEIEYQIQDLVEKDSEKAELNDTTKKHYEKFDSVHARQQVTGQLFEMLSAGQRFTDMADLQNVLGKMKAILDIDIDKEKKWDFVEQGFGLPWNSWMAFYSYFSRINVLNNEEFDRYFSIFVNHSIWSIQFFKNWCCFTRLPNRIHRDAQNRLHSVEGSVAEWRGRPQDKNYFIHGVSFTDEALWERVVSGRITTQEVMKDISNMEKRNAILSVIPARRLIEDLDAQKIDEMIPKKRFGMSKYTQNLDKMHFDKPMTLYKIMGDKLGLPNNENVFVLFYTDPSVGREYFSYIEPKNATSVRAAMASKFGMTPSEYDNNIVAET